MDKVDKADGFTLIEMMVVLVIMLILAAMVYPSYSGYVIKARRLEGQVALLDALQQQERYYTRYNVYKEFSAGSANPDEQRFKWWSGSSAAASAYELSAQACPGMPLQACIEVRATPGTAKVDPNFRDPECATLTLTSTGEQRAAGPGTRCWP
jgi:type IV pilus assembly protein PilE